MSTNYYDILNISFSATPKEIKKAYYKACLQWHPDKNKSTNAEEKFKEIKKAYETLSDPTLKQNYDRQNIPKTNKHNSKKPFSFKNLFQTFTKEKIHKHTIGGLFTKLVSKIKQNVSKTEVLHYMKLLHNYYNTFTVNQNNNQFTPEKKQTSIKTTYQLEVSLHDFYNYSEKQFKIPILTKCCVCKNHYNSLCKICNGTIYYISIKLFTLKLNKTQYLLKQSGNHMMGYEYPGDLIIKLNDKKHQYFKRTGKFNLVYAEIIDTQNITPEGNYQIIFKHLNEKTYSCILENYVDEYEKIKKKPLIKIENFGLPNHQGSYGDLFILLKDYSKQKQLQNNDHLLKNTFEKSIKLTKITVIKLN